MLLTGPEGGCGIGCEYLACCGLCGGPATPPACWNLCDIALMLITQNFAMQWTIYSINNNSKLIFSIVARYFGKRKIFRQKIIEDATQYTKSLFFDDDTNIQWSWLQYEVGYVRRESRFLDVDAFEWWNNGILRKIRVWYLNTKKTI